MSTYQLSVSSITIRLVAECSVETSAIGDDCSLVVDSGGSVWSAFGQDFEDTLLTIRTKLESDGLLLLCNRFRKNALVTPMARQMSNGLSCYLVSPFEGLDPELVVDSLGSAPEAAVCTQAEAADFVEKWKSWFELSWPLRQKARLLQLGQVRGDA